MSAWGVALLIGVVLIVLLVALAIAVWWGALKFQKPAAQGEPLPARPTDLAPPARLRTTIAIAMRELRLLVAGGRGPADVPWALVIGVGHADYEALLPPPLQAQHELSWHDDQRLAKVGTVSFREGGVVLGFEAGLDAPQPRERLLDLLREVEVVRPLRPLDSLVVVVPCGFLADATPDQAAARGRELYALILAVQQRTGWRVPVYLLLSGAEALDGFAPLAQAVLDHSANPMIGWPAPKALDSLFDPSWLDEAFATMRATLSTEQLHVLMGMADDAASENVLLFPERLAQIRPALAVLLAQMLENSAYHEGFMLRGIFLTGATEPPAAPAPEPVPAESQPLPLGPANPDLEPAAIVEAPPPPSQPLAATLFTRKIFPESGLAQPAYGEMTRRHRLVRRAKVALAACAALFLVGIGLVSFQTGRHFPPVRALLANIENIEDRTDRLNAQTRDRSGGCREPEGAATVLAAGDTSPFERRRALSAELLQRMSDLGVNRVQTVFAPTSFLAPTNGKVRNAIKAGFHDVVFNAIADSMATRAGIDALLSNDAPASDGTAYWTVTVDNALVYNRHYRIAGQLAGMTAEHAAAVRNFSTLVTYALFEQLPPGFARNYELYSDGITGYAVPCLSAARTTATLEQVLEAHYEHAIDQLYLRNRLAATIGLIEARFTPTQGIDASDRSLTDLVDQLDTIAAELAAPSKYDWVYVEHERDLALLPVDRIKRLEMLEPSYADRLPERSRQRVFEAAIALRNAQLFDAPILAMDASPPPPVAPAPGDTPTPAPDLAPEPGEVIAAPRLSKPASDTRDFLRALFAQPYMNANTPAMPGEVGGRISWDMARLQAAQAAVDGYAAFLATGSGEAPAELRALALASAKQHFAHYLSALVSAAAQPLASVGVDAETANFVQALPVLLKIRGALRGVGDEASATALDARIGEQAGRLLADADRALGTDGGPYAIDPAGLAAWDGSGSLAAALFGVETVDDLKATLPPRRARVADIARTRAAPLLGYLRDPGAAASAASIARANKWQAVLRTLEAYDAGSPSNSLVRLEQYISVDLDKLSRRDCVRARAFTTRGDDYFAQQQAAISARVVGQCRRAAAGSTEAQFAALRQAFNTTLAGRFPFSADPEAPPADPADVQAFFGEYGATFEPLKADVEATPSFGRSGRVAALALGQLARVRAALAPMLDATGPAPLSYKVGVSFFTDPALAEGQEQVIEASLGTPAVQASVRGPDAFAWRNGQPVLARFRWAINAPSIPLSGGKCVPQPAGSTAAFRVDGDWALLRLLRRYAPDPGSRASTVAGAPVAFDVRLCANQARASGGTEVENARVLARLALSMTVAGGDKPDRQVPVTLPDFPYSLDPLERSR